jgi:cytochrome c
MTARSIMGLITLLSLVSLAMMVNGQDCSSQQFAMSSSLDTLKITSNYPAHYVFVSQVSSVSERVHTCFPSLPHLC